MAQSIFAALCGAGPHWAPSAMLLIQLEMESESRGRFQSALSWMWPMKSTCPVLPECGSSRGDFCKAAELAMILEHCAVETKGSFLDVSLVVLVVSTCPVLEAWNAPHLESSRGL
jgi:hypothetical protein